MSKKEKSPRKKYTLKDLRKDFPTEEACLEWLKDRRYPDGIYCKNCEEVTPHYLVASRKSFSCQNCGHHVHPTAGTIFHKSSTPLTIWFEVVFRMTQTRMGISAKQIEREMGVTYKTAWRMCKLVRQQLEEDKDPFDSNDTVEVDESYFGGVKKGGKRGRGSENKTAVIGLVERGGRVVTEVIPNVKKATLQPIVEENIEKGATVYTDELKSYNGLTEAGYNHAMVLNSHDIYVIGNVHTNTIEGFWGNTKPGITGVYRHVSPAYLQCYLNEYAFRYNHRNDVTPMFVSFLSQMAHKSAHLL
ncbi:MAG: IS1595 family transposase [Anaerolineaceae bacterium]|nr:IS1595 family transposase [Anaerolineaceae bacterium]